MNDDGSFGRAARCAHFLERERLHFHRQPLTIGLRWTAALRAGARCELSGRRHRSSPRMHGGLMLPPSRHPGETSPPLPSSHTRGGAAGALVAHEWDRKGGDGSGGGDP